VAVPERFKDYKLPEETAILEAHLWDELLDPYPTDACKEIRVWVLQGPGPVLILNEREVEVIVHKGVKPHFTKWRFRTPQAATQFAEMMLPYSMVVGLI
jgi:hypothetical protein